MKKLKAQLEQKTQKNGPENGSSPDGDVLQNGTDPNILELQSRNPHTPKVHTLDLSTSFPDNVGMLALRFPGDSNRVISDLKFKLVKAEQEATASEQNVSRGEGIQTGIFRHCGGFYNPRGFLLFQVTRLEGQVMRYKSAAENAEKVEDELKAEKRKLQREVAGRPVS